MALISYLPGETYSGCRQGISSLRPCKSFWLKNPQSTHSRRSIHLQARHLLMEIEVDGRCGGPLIPIPSSVEPGTGRDGRVYQTIYVSLSSRESAEVRTRNEGFGFVALHAPQDTPTSRKLGWWSFSYRVVWELLPRLCTVAMYSLA